MTNLETILQNLKEIVNHQAKMESLWLAHPTLIEAMQQAALRHLHAVIENDPIIAEEFKKAYWELEGNL